MAAFRLADFSTGGVMTLTWTGGGPDNDWTDPLNWSGDAVPQASDNVAISGTAAETIEVGATDAAVANALDVTDPAAALEIDGSLALGGAPVFDGNTVTVNGTLYLAGQTLDNAVVRLAGSLNVSTLGPNLTVVQTGPNAGVSGELVNQGTIEAGLSGDTLMVNMVENAGIIDVSNGATLRMPNPTYPASPLKFVNAAGGIITVSGGASFNLELDDQGFVSDTNTWENDGQIILESGAGSPSMGRRTTRR